jgi:tetratricopeptide (TPR) repeat protein
MGLRSVLLCFLTLSIFPSAAAGQSKDESRSMIDYSGGVVSVHQLSIPDKAREAYNKGVRQLNAKDCTNSVPNFQRAIRFFPAFYEAYNLLGVAELAMQRWDDAEAAFRKSIELSSGTFAAPRFGLGLILCHRNQCGDAEAMIRDGLDLNPADASGDFCLAWVLYTLGRLSEAERSAREATLYKPDFPEPYLLLAQIHLLQRNSSAEIEDLDRYLKLDPSSPRSAKAKTARADVQRILTKEDATARTNP